MGADVYQQCAGLLKWPINFALLRNRKQVHEKHELTPYQAFDIIAHELLYGRCALGHEVAMAISKCQMNHSSHWPRSVPGKVEFGALADNEGGQSKRRSVGA